MFYQFFIFWGAIIIATANGSIQCQPKDVPKDVLTSFINSVPNLQTGQIKVQNSNQNIRYNQFNVTLNREIANYRLSVSIQNIHSFSPKNGFDFKVSAVPYATWFIGYIVMEKETSWRWVSLSYAASGRTDFIVGSFIVENNKLVDPSFNNTQINVKYSLSIEENLSNSYYFTMPFITGIRTYDDSLALSFSGSKFNSTSKQLTFTIKLSYNLYPLQFLSVSYLIFHMTAQLEISRLYDLFNIPNTIDTFLGVSSLTPNPNLYKKQKANTTRPLLEASPVNIETFNEMFGVNGIMVQTQRSLDILFLPVINHSTTLSCISKSACQQYRGEMVYEQIGVYDIESKCYICANNSLVNHATGLCQCIEGFTSVNKSCVRLSESCKVNEVYSDKVRKCVCAPLYINISGTCISILSICKSNQIYFQGKCIQVVFNTNASPCPAGYILINKNCQKQQTCIQGQILDIKTNKCLCPEGTAMMNGTCKKCGGSNETAINGKCQCKDKYYRIDGICKMCGRYAFFNGQKCVCSRNYQGDGFTCTVSSNLQAQLASPLSGAYIPGGTVIINSGV